MDKEKSPGRRRGAFSIMGSLLVLVKPLLHIMAAAVLFGSLGYLSAIFLTILAGQVILHGLFAGAVGEFIAVRNAWLVLAPVNKLLTAIFLLALLRGILHYLEQYCNHFIAFKLLAILRHKVFEALRRLCPAKLECRDKGNLISIITTDIELLEVFYAHTLSPIAIALVTCLTMVVFIGSYHWLAGLFALAAYVLVGIFIPLWNTRSTGQGGMDFRTDFGDLNSFVLDSLRGLEETLQYGQEAERKRELTERSKRLSAIQGSLSRREGLQRACSNLLLLLASFGMLALTVWLYGKGEVGFDGILTPVLAMMGSFGPALALANLSNNLHQTLAAGERVLSLLEERPLVEEIKEKAGEEKEGEGFLRAERVNFAYEEEEILKDYSLSVQAGKITGIYGRSGCGKSTLLKLFMRFWDVSEGSISIDGKDVREIPTASLRRKEGYVTQETHLFHDSIANNIGLAKEGAKREEIIRAAKKASLHDFILSLPQAYDTRVGELGDSLSDGEKQRIGLARAFLHDSKILLLDEPTSNLDALNEGVILKALEESAKEKTVVLVSHRISTLKVADAVYRIEGREKI